MLTLASTSDCTILEVVPSDEVCSLVAAGTSFLVIEPIRVCLTSVFCLTPGLAYVPDTTGVESVFDFLTQACPLVGW